MKNSVCRKRPLNDFSCRNLWVRGQLFPDFGFHRRVPCEARKQLAVLVRYRLRRSKQVVEPALSRLRHPSLHLKFTTWWFHVGGRPLDGLPLPWVGGLDYQAAVDWKATTF